MLPRRSRDEFAATFRAPPRTPAAHGYPSSEREVGGVNVPILETPRLILRAHTKDDFAESYAMWSDPIVTRFIGGKPSTRTQAWSRLLNYAGHWQLAHFGYWVVEEKADRRFIGEVGFADFKREIEAAMRDVPEIGWALAPRAHGKGFALEALGAALRYGDEHFAAARTVCMIDCANAASVRLATKVGYRPFQAAVFGGNPVDFYERAAALDPPRSTDCAPREARGSSQPG